MRLTTIALILLIAGTLTACEAGDPETAGVKKEERAQAPAQKLSREEIIAQNARGKVTCPPPKAKHASIDVMHHDIRGVRVGMSYEEAANIILCSNEMMILDTDNLKSYRIDTYGEKVRQGFWAMLASQKEPNFSELTPEERVKKAMNNPLGAKEYKVGPGQSLWYVSTMGLPGEERVITLAREEVFAEGKNPSVDSVKAALIKKYGQQPNDIGSTNEMYWVYDPESKSIDRNDLDYLDCRVYPNPRYPVSIHSKCGASISAKIIPLKNNDDLAKTLQVKISHMSYALDKIEDTKDRLLAKDEARRAKELEEAASNASELSL